MFYYLCRIRINRCMILYTMSTKLDIVGILTILAVCLVSLNSGIAVRSEISPFSMDSRMYRPLSGFPGQRLMIGTSPLSPSKYWKMTSKRQYKQSSRHWNLSPLSPIEGPSRRPSNLLTVGDLMLNDRLGIHIY